MRKYQIAAILATILLAFAVKVFFMALNAEANIRAFNDMTFVYSRGE
jgi:hypothetical protein